MRQSIATFLAGVLLLGTLGLALVLGVANSVTSVNDQTFVVTTIYPLADFVKNVGGKYVYVSNIVPAGAEPHEYEPTPREVTRLLEADVLIYLGAGLDAWAEDMAPQASESGAIVLAVEDMVDLTPLEMGEDRGDENELGEDEHEHGDVDPHVWLDPILSQEIVLAIRDALSSADPEHAADYHANADNYVQALKALDITFANSLSNCELNDIIVSHDAFGYLARRYGFNIHPISGMSPESEPSVRDLARLAEEARELQVDTVFFETLVSPELAETLANEIGAKTDVLNPLEGLSQAELDQGEDYLSIMDQNRQALAAAMLCQ